MYKNAAVFKFHATNINIVLSFFLRGIILDKNRIICYLTLIIAILLLLYGGLSTAATLILAVVAIAIILFTRRAYLYFVKANRIYSAHDYPRYDEAFKYYKKTLKAGTGEAAGPALRQGRDDQEPGQVRPLPRALLTG